MPVLSNIDITQSRLPATSTDLVELTKLANEALARNDNTVAFEFLEQITARPEASVRSCVAAGILAAERREFDQSRTYFNQALAKSPLDFDARYNLALIELMSGSPDQAEEHIRTLLKNNPDHHELLSDLGVILMTQGRTGRALGYFRRALRADPNLSKPRDAALEFYLDNNLLVEAGRFLDWNETLHNVSAASRTEIARWRERLLEHDRPTSTGTPANAVVDVPIRAFSQRLTGRKLAFFASHQTFIKDIMAGVGQHNLVRLFRSGSADDMKQLLRWADLAWFEWCDELVIQATKWSRRCPVICRLHSYEAFTDMPSRVDWSKIDRLLFVSEAVRRLVEPQLRGRVKTHVITNGVDLDRFRIPARKRYGKRIASVGYINYKKNTPLLLYCFKKIHEYDPAYTLHIAGEHQDPRMQLYIDNFLRRHPLPVRFDGWVTDMPAWYANKDFVISTSLFESFHYSIAEGMACGLMPLIHDWYGADMVYPSEYLFGDPDDCLKLLQTLEQEDRASRAEANRVFVCKQYDQRRKQEEIESLLCEVLMAGTDEGRRAETLTYE
ncbi:MAG: tetratricopeptide repeat protein [Candidatus Zixiibacteriota bacterium]